MNRNLEEHGLVWKVGQGDVDAYHILVREHLRSIVNYAYRLLMDRTEAEDVAQETFLRLWTHAAQWKPDARLSSWLHRIAHNLCIDRLRQRKQQDSESLEKVRASDRPSTLLARKQVSEAVEEAMGTLPERQRAAIALVHYQGMSNTEASGILGISVDALESLLARGRNALRKRLRDFQQQAKGEVYEG